MNTTRRTLVLDIRHTPPQERRWQILNLFDSLRAGDTLKVVYDHDPRPLHYQFLLERRGQFSWEAHQEAPQEWVAWIKKLR